ncbi:RES family NAD+ phosphorylase [Terriglobus sp. TAA 43]|uniref:RES family NAD+ phosphorylase n=1 Tax=Terriglobus sp. TAA 43 TaxID=278961 RepID=UPI000A01DB53|nr:RES family NAD+ phosphorylase [Terriglobus sp. TAA 43]
MHRLLPSRYSETGTVLDDLAEDEEMLEKLIRLDGATNDRIQGEQFGLPGISTYELIYGIANAHIVRAAFLHPSPTGARFSGPTRGAWYAGDKLETSFAEVSYHKAKRLADIIVPESVAGVPESESSTYDDWLADFHGEFHSLEPATNYATCLVPEPVPACYAEPQKLAQALMKEKSNGILYPSVRKKGGRCLVCFRPALVYRPRRDKRYLLSLYWDRNRYRQEIHEVPLKQSRNRP